MEKKPGDQSTECEAVRSERRRKSQDQVSNEQSPESCYIGQPFLSLPAPGSVVGKLEVLCHEDAYTGSVPKKGLRG